MVIGVNPTVPVSIRITKLTENKILCMYSYGNSAKCRVISVSETGLALGAEYEIFSYNYSFYPISLRVVSDRLVLLTGYNDGRDADILVRLLDITVTK
jgi:hypothetical protein